MDCPLQRIVNVLAVASFAVSGAVVASGVYVYVNRDSIIDGVKSKVMGGFAGGALGGGIGGDLPVGTPNLAPVAPDVAIPSGGLGVPTF